MNIRKMIAVFLCLVLMMTSFGLLYHSILKIELHINELSCKLESQAYEIEKLNKETEDWKFEINNLYEMNKSHANCVAMAVLMNEDSVLANAYERTEEEQIKLYGNDNIFANF